MHIPVLLNEAIRALDPKPGEFFIDGTFGRGGHSRAIWNKIQPGGKLLAVDWNGEAVAFCRREFKGVDCVEGNFAGLTRIIKEKKLAAADGLLIDLGVSSDELEASGRGFSFRPPAGGEPLLMTYNDESKPVREILKELSEEDLADVIRRYGEERFAGRIARAIKSASRIMTSGDLADVVAEAVPRGYERGRIHPATRTFMALRIYANGELKNLEKVLQDLPQIISTGGRAAIISFHSLEDRLVKNSFRDFHKKGLAEVLTKKPIIADRQEILANPRSRSAKLRAIKFL